MTDVLDYQKRKRYALGSYIRANRERLGLSYEEVGEVLGVHAITVRKWEASKTIKPMVWLAFQKAFLDKVPRGRTVKSDSGMKRWHTFYRMECKTERPHIIPDECLL
jgi:transcriptional regulator with XRE-family HTH domain